MKEKISLLILAMMTIFVSSIITFAGDKQPNYQPTSTPKTEEAWWDWFNSLPSEIQERIRFRPDIGTKGQDALPQEMGCSNDSMIGAPPRKASLAARNYSRTNQFLAKTMPKRGARERIF